LPDRHPYEPDESVPNIWRRISEFWDQPQTVIGICS
jgi:hypothetical protein